MNTKLLGVSKDEKYIFTNKGFYVCENEGFYVPYNEGILPYLVQIVKDNNDFELNSNIISINEYLSKPRKFLTIISEIFTPQQSLKLIKEWETKFGNKLYRSILNESTDKVLLEQIVNQSWDGIKILLEDASWLGNVWDKTKKVASGIGKLALTGLSAATKKIILPILNKGVIPLLRWIRRNAYTSIGIVVDVVTAIIPYTTAVNKSIWGLIVLLDLYELIVGESDPNDQERNQNPYMFLIIDLISFIFSSAVGQTTKVGLKAAASGTKMSSGLVKTLKSLINKLPTLKNGLRTVSNFLVKIPGAKKVIEIIFKSIDKIIMGVETFIRQLLSKRGAMAVATGVSIAWFFEPRNLKVGDSGNDVAAVNKYFSEYHNLIKPDCVVDQNVINSIKNDGNKFTKNTETAVKTVEGCLKRDPEFKDLNLKVDGEINDYELGIYASVEMDDRNVVTKFIPHSAKSKFQETVGGIMKHLSQGAEKVIKPISRSVQA
jgi:hypothetical protein